MKKILFLIAVLSVGGSLFAASKVACRNCGVRDDNIIFRCRKGHISCSKCARSRDFSERMQDAFSASFGVQGGTAQRCTFVNRYDEACDESISQVIADNRSPEKIKREKQIARQKAQRKAAAEAQAEQKRQAGIKALDAEHSTLVQNLNHVVRTGSTANLKLHVQKMLEHYQRHNGFGSKRGRGLFGFGGTSGESCNILNHMVNTALRLNNDAQIQILFTNINPGDDVVASGFQTGKPVYTKLFANKLKIKKVFDATADKLITSHCRTRSTQFIHPVIQALKNANFTNEIGDAHYPGDKPLVALFKRYTMQKELPPFEVLKPFYDVLEAENLEEHLTVLIAQNRPQSYRYIIDKRGVKGSVRINHDDLLLYPYHLLICKNDFTYAKKVRVSASIFDDKIQLTESARNNKSAKHKKEIIPVEYMAELNNFEAVKFLVDEEACEFGTFSKYNESQNAINWAQKNKNKEMEKYLDDKISGWTTAGIWTRNILLAPVIILLLIAAH